MSQLKRKGNLLFVKRYFFSVFSIWNNQNEYYIKFVEKKVKQIGENMWWADHRLCKEKANFRFFNAWIQFNRFFSFQVANRINFVSIFRERLEIATIFLSWSHLCHSIQCTLWLNFSRIGVRSRSWVLWN